MHNFRRYATLNLMTNKIIIAFIVVLVIIGLLLLFINRPNPSKNNSSNTSQQNGQNNQPATNSSDTPNSGKVVTIQVTKEGFTPGTVTVETGTKVIWTNVSGAIAAVHSADHPTHITYPPLNLGEFQDGSSVQLIFDKPGTYKYHDHLKPQLQGSITVQ